MIILHFITHRSGPCACVPDAAVDTHISFSQRFPPEWPTGSTTTQLVSQPVLESSRMQAFSNKPVYIISDGQGRHFQ